ncbi:MAG: 50S ribosomal protein L18 [Gemmatimonadota bacterium]|nr:50S ribosomal protein L18 [Gemmatimonadota bacterium]MDH5803983.1 50S ribosomal protein L18 [Gemmatimonadota bacterium]
MRPLQRPKNRDERRYRRRLRVRKKVQGTADRPRLAVFRSLKHVYVQLIDDVQGVTLAGFGDMAKDLKVDGKGKTAASFAVGQRIAEMAKAKGITKVVFDRGGYPYHGRVKAVADGARKGGLEF